MRVAAVQMRSGASVGANIEAMEALVRAAAKDGASYVQTPEMTGIVQRSPKQLFAEIKRMDEDGLVPAAAALARELGIWLHVGSHAIRLDDERAANRAFLFNPKGEIAATYDKIHMFDVDLDNGESWRESKIYKPGDRAVVVPVDSTGFGLSVCYDIRFPRLYRELALAGASVLTAPAAFTRQTGRAHWHVLMRARAIENGAWMIAAAQGGEHEDGRETFGHSVIVNPWGEIIAELDHEEPGFLVAEIEPDAVAEARSKIPNLANAREFNLEKGPGKQKAVA